MTTPRDLLLVSLDVPGNRPVERGDLSLALAGAELTDLLADETVSLDGDRIVPGLAPATDDRLMDQAAESLVRQAPYETVQDWLWRRGRGLAAAYVAEMRARGQLAGPRRHSWIPGSVDRPEPVDSPARRAAADRWAAHEPVLALLAATLGIGAVPAEELAVPDDDAVVTVLAAVGHAVTELEGVRQKRRIEDAAFDNIWRAPG
jgi:Golgi phosphoprotein 3 (GPP34)